MAGADGPQCCSKTIVLPGHLPKPVLEGAFFWGRLALLDLAADETHIDEVSNHNRLWMDLTVRLNFALLLKGNERCNKHGTDIRWC